MTDESALSPIQETSNDAIEALLAQVRSMPGRRRLRTWLWPSVMLVAYVAAMVGLASGGYLETPWPAVIVFALIWGSGIGLWLLAERREVRTIESLADCKELRALGGLLECANFSNRRARKAVSGTLLELLPLLTEEHFALLGTGSREALNALLYGDSSEMALAALFAIEQVGDGTALPYLTSIAAGKGIPNTLRDRKSEVQERAQHAVAVIHERIERQNRASVLLRAAQVPGTPSGQLVRPALGESVVKEQELLRPDASAEPDPGPLGGNNDRQ